MALQIPATAGFVGVDTTSAKTIQLPLASQKPGRVLTIKDRTGGAATFPITIQTQGGNTFEDGTTSYVINTAYGSIQFIARATQWLKTLNPLIDPTSTLALSTGFLTVSSIRGDGSQLFNLPALSSLSLQSTVRGLGSIGYISTAQLQSTVLGLSSNVSSMIDPVELASSIVGLGTIGFTSSIGLTFILNSTVTGLSSNISSMIEPLELASTVTGLGTVGFISSIGLDARFRSTVEGLGTAGYASTSFVQQTSNWARNLLQNTSTWISTVALFTSNTSNFSRGFLQDFSTGLSSVALFTSNTSNFSRGFLQDYSTAVSSVALFTSNTSNWSSNILQNYSSLITSTMIGLGTVGYISTPQLTSTVSNFLFQFRTSSLVASTATIGILSTQQIVHSSIAGTIAVYQTLSSQALFVSSLYTATRTATPMFITF